MGKILNFIPQAASAIKSTNSLASPRKSNAGKGLSSPLVSIIPAEARRKPKNGSFDAKEPTSPKVSCFGQINCNKKRQKKSDNRAKQVSCGKGVKKLPLRMVKNVPQKGGKHDGFMDKPTASDQGVVPSLGQMKRFVSGCGALSDFDWGAQGDLDEEDQVIVIVPKKEINLWKRRAIAPPIRLQL
ncbi:hypothetical protein FNV43_RR18640 [Rhamnella rubrinervis]|uniref:Syringolide-induced protein 14-1-1 n=1 Tax=Rhamnella rubrinervis TaxID=2594499 RepID=A0A8K0E4Y4_9ROSA|nr:hypothetical protein FNV43_RR18640 [Rhamnella rubrinervis]